jgi:hypothetical protein
MSRPLVYGYDDEVAVVQHERHSRHSPRTSTQGGEFAVMRPTHSPRPSSRSPRPRPPPDRGPMPSSRDRVTPTRKSSEPYKRLIIAADGKFTNVYKIRHCIFSEICHVVGWDSRVTGINIESRFTDDIPLFKSQQNASWRRQTPSDCCTSRI